MPNRRLIRVAESIRAVLGRLALRERTLEGKLITITGVTVSPDLRHAQVFVTHLDGSTPDKDVVLTLNALKEEWQREINKTLSIKYTPRLQFFVDEAQRRGDRILQIMTEIDPTRLDPNDPDFIDPSDAAPTLTSEKSPDLDPPAELRVRSQRRAP